MCSNRNTIMQNANEHWLVAVQNVRMDLELETEKAVRLDREMSDIAGATKDDSEVSRIILCSYLRHLQFFERKVDSHSYAIVLVLVIVYNYVQARSLRSTLTYLQCCLFWKFALVLNKMYWNSEMQSTFLNINLVTFSVFDSQKIFELLFTMRLLFDFS